MLQVDPSQKKLVAVLLTVLVGAVVIFVIRIMPRNEPVQPAAQPAQAAAASQPVVSDGELEASVPRNPFRQPAGVIHAVRSTDDRFVTSAPIRPERETTFSTGQHYELGPMPVPSIGGSEKPSPEKDDKQSKDTGDKQATKLPASVLGVDSAGDNPKQDSRDRREDRARPDFRLMATMRGAESFSAVLRTDESHAWVVKTGDVIDGRYKVARIQENLAVLLDGKEVIIATRPRS